MKSIAAVAIIAAMLAAPTAHADTSAQLSQDICAVLDAYRNVDGVTLVAIELFSAGASAEQAAEIVVESVYGYCPHNVGLLQEFSRRYGDSNVG